MAYTVELSRAATRDFRRLPRVAQVKLRPVIDGLATDPRPHGCEKLAHGEDLYRVREGDHRVIYAVRDSELVVLVVMLGDRREIYRRLKNL